MPDVIGVDTHKGWTITYFDDDTAQAYRGKIVSPVFTYIIGWSLAEQAKDYINSVERV